MEEIWKDIFGYEGLYQVSNLGQVKSLPKEWKMFGRDNSIKKHNGMILKGRKSDGYVMYNFGKSKSGHRLVAESFIPNPENKPEVNHKNGIKSDNRVDNLEWATNKENQEHAFKTGLNKNFGENHSRAKLTNEEVAEIRSKYIPIEYSSRMLAKEYGVHKNTILAIINNKRWNHK